jgi:dTDP-4-amino-4,6-dideoxygalactose transaminase
MAAILRIQLGRLDDMLGRMRAQKKRFVEKLSGHPRLRSTPYHDLDGDCGTTVCFQFEAEKQARAFAGALSEEGVGASLPIDSGRHVYCNWEPVMERRGGHHTFTDPFRMPENRGCRADYAKDMCPQTLDILARTVGTGTHPDWDEEEVDRRIGICERAAEKI